MHRRNLKYTHTSFVIMSNKVRLPVLGIGAERPRKNLKYAQKKTEICTEKKNLKYIHKKSKIYIQKSKNTTLKI